MTEKSEATQQKKTSHIGHHTNNVSYTITSDIAPKHLNSVDKILVYTYNVYITACSDTITANDTFIYT